MEKRKFIKNLFLVLYLFFLCALVTKETYALEPVLTRCKMSDEYAAWLELSEEEQNEVMRPAYCDSSADKTNIAVSSVTSKIDSMFNESMQATLPSKYDLRATDYAPVLKNQGSTGGCWAFSTTTVLETLIEIKYGEDYLFSTRHIEYASTRGFKNNKINEYGYNRSPGTGGDYHMAASYLANGLGPVLEEDMPFEEDESTIDISEIDQDAVFDVNDVVLSIGTGGVACTSSEITQIKNYIYQYGAVAASSYMLISEDYYNSSTGAYYYNGTSAINHAVTIIGWDDNYSKNNFSSKNRPKSNGAWIVQNSYGTKYSKDGYNYISYEDVRTCDQIMAVIDVDDDINDNAYILDKLGYNQYFGYYYGNTGSTEAYAMNVFTKASGKNELLKEITIGSNGTGSYQIYYMEGNGSGSKISDMTLIGSGDLNHSGYVTHKLDNPILLNKNITDYSIAVYYSMDTSTMPIPVSMKDSTRYSPVSADSGRTFASSNGTSWTDLSDYDGTVLVASIKAFTDDASYYIELGSAKVSVGTKYYEINIKFNYSNIDTSKLEFVLTGTDGFEYKPDLMEYSNSYIYLGINKNYYSGTRILTVYYDGNYVGEVSFYLNDPLTSSVYTIDDDNGYIYVPPKTYKTTFITNVKGLLEPSSLGTSGYVYTGMKVENYIIVVYGDVTEDGYVNIADVVKIANHTISSNILNKDYLLVAANVAQDNYINIADVVKTANYTIDNSMTLGW